jgi:hypothetical protein
MLLALYIDRRHHPSLDSRFLRNIDPGLVDSRRSLLMDLDVDIFDSVCVEFVVCNELARVLGVVCGGVEEYDCADIDGAVFEEGSEAL